MGFRYRGLAGRTLLRHALLSTTVLGGLAAVALLRVSPALAACVPAAGPGTPAPGTSVTCESVVVNQNGPNGYGDGTQVGLKINQIGSVFSTGAFAPGVEGAALRLATGNTVTNHGITEGNGTIAGLPAGYGIVGSNLTVTNLKGFFINGNVSAISENTQLSSTNPAGTTTVLNEGRINGGNAFGVQGTTLKLDNIGSAFIKGATAASGGTVDIFNSGTIQGTSTGISAGQGTINNLGTITGGGGSGGIVHVGTNKTLNIVNSGTINNPDGGSAIRNLTTPSGGGSASTTNITNTKDDEHTNALLFTSSTNLIGTILFPGTTLNINNAGLILTGGGQGAAILNTGHDSHTNVVNTGTISGAVGISTQISVADNLNVTTFPGAATIFNAGVITGTGGTAIRFGGNGNILTLAPSSVINGNVFGGINNTFQLGGSTGSGSLDTGLIGPGKQYQGFVNFQKIDGSTWTLTGANAMPLDWSVLGGTLNVTGDQQFMIFRVQDSVLSVNGTAGTAIVGTGGLLSGTGFVRFITMNGGTLSPGNSIGTISTHNLTFVGPGNYLVEVSPTEADRTNVFNAGLFTGTASLHGTLIAVGTGGNYSVGKRYTVINAETGVTGTFSNLVVTGNFGVTKPHIEYDANNVYLVLDPNAVSPFLVNATGNQRAVAAAVDAAIVAGSQAAPFLALFNLTAAQLNGALDQLSGEVHPSTMGMLADESLYARSAVLGRLRQAAYGGNTRWRPCRWAGRRHSPPTAARRSKARSPMRSHRSSPRRR